MVFCLLYSSTAATALNQTEMEALLGVSRLNNTRADVTGVLLHVHAEEPGQAYFVQMLEGDQPDVEETYARIAADELHRDPVILTSGAKDRRMFEGWSMRVESVTDEELRRRLGEAGVAAGAGARQAVRDPEAMAHLVDSYA